MSAPQAVSAPGMRPQPDRYGAATLALEQGRPSEAVRFLEQILAEQPDNEKATELLNEAKEKAVRAASLDLVRNGRLAVRKGDVEEALQCFERASELDANNLEARYSLAEALVERERDLERAITLIKEVIVLGGQRARYFGTLGDACIKAKQMGRAADAFTRALELEPGNRLYKKKLKSCT